MDISAASSVLLTRAMSSPDNIGRPPSRHYARSIPPTSSSQSTTSSTTTLGTAGLLSAQRAMAIPGARHEVIPPALPPPRQLHDIDNGNDIAYNHEHRYCAGSPPVPQPAIKEGSSLLGGYIRPTVTSTDARGGQWAADAADHRTLAVSADDDEVNASHSHRPDTIKRAPSSGPTGHQAIPTPVRRAPSPTSTTNHRLRGLAQDSASRPRRNDYDAEMLKKISKTNSPPRQSAPGAESPRLSQAPSFQTSEMMPRLRTHADPPSGGRSPLLDHAGGPMALDPELFVPYSGSISHRPSLTDSIPRDEVTPSRSGRSSYDHNMYTPASEPPEEAAGFRSIHADDSPVAATAAAAAERPLLHHGMKRKSPPHDEQVDERPREFLRLATRPAPRSPTANCTSHHNSISSATSSVQPSSYASSGQFSAVPSSLTSMSSLDTHSPRDYLPGPAYITSAGPVDSPIAVLANRRGSDKVAPRKVSTQPAPPEIRPAPARIGNHYICACCPKKPRKFETEEQLRVHENEKQYACAFCHNRFKNKNEAERHQNSLHLRKHSWSCAALVNFRTAFSPSGAVDSNSLAQDACGYCGEEFDNLPTPDWDRRLEHLTNVHKFGECNLAKKFFRADHFRQHLKHSHAGRSGKWTNILEHACVRDELPVEPASLPDSMSEHRQGGPMPHVTSSTLQPPDASGSGGSVALEPRAGS